MIFRFVHRIKGILFQLGALADVRKLDLEEHPSLLSNLRVLQTLSVVINLLLLPRALVSIVLIAWTRGKIFSAFVEAFCSIKYYT